MLNLKGRLNHTRSLFSILYKISLISLFLPNIPISVIILS